MSLIITPVTDIDELLRALRLRLSAATCCAYVGAHEAQADFRLARALAELGNDLFERCSRIDDLIERRPSKGDGS